MNQELSRGPEDDLRRALRQWRVEEPLPAGFHRAVWRKVAGLSSDRSVSPGLRMWEWLALQLGRPAWSIGVAVVLLGTGLLAGYWQATAQTARWDDLMARRYVQSVDPYLQVGAAP
jgi:hypothetical protein